MKASLLFLSNLLVTLFFSSAIHAADSYAEYKMTGVNNTTVISKMYSKDGNMRAEVYMKMGERQFTTTSLMLKRNPNVAFVFNSLTKTYTEAKIAPNEAIKDITIKVLGIEKIGTYNCTHVKMTSDGKSWDAWFSKDLPSINYPIGGNNELNNQKVINELKSKGVTGMLVKMVMQSPLANAKAITMELVKYESKTLDASLFSMPVGYKKSSIVIDPGKMKNMTTEQKKEMIMKMMKEKSQQH